RRGRRRGDTRAGQEAEAPRAVKPRQQRPPRPALERDAVGVRGDVDDAEAGPEHARRRNEGREAGREGRERETARREAKAEPRGPATAPPPGEPAGGRQRGGRGEGDGEDDHAELAAVEAEAVLERGQPGRPGSVYHAEGEEGASEPDVHHPGSRPSGSNHA